MKQTLFILLLLLTSMSYAQTVQIGTQVWMTKNLDVATFRNGDTILEAKTDEEWRKAAVSKQPAWCYYNNDPANGTKYGKLYNWYAVNDPRGLAPEGYHVPSDAEWTKLEDFLQPSAGKKMKSATGWNSDDTKSENGWNSSGFSGLPCGWRFEVGLFTSIGYGGEWWSSTEPEAGRAWSLYLDINNGYVTRDLGEKGDGFSVRCLRD